MATTAMCGSFKGELAQALHNFTATTGNVFKLALIKVTPGGTYDKTFTNVGTPGSGSPTVSNLGTDETSGAGYTTGGFAWTAAQNQTPAVDTSSTNNIGWWNFTVNPSWTSASFSTVAGIIFNSTNSNRAVSVHDFGGTQTVASGTLTAILPTNNSANSILRVT